MSIVTVAAGVPFLDRIASEWLACDPAAQTEGAGLILVPGRRAARSLMEAFLRMLEGKAALLPRIVPIGDVEEDALTSVGVDVDLPPAVEPERRLAILSLLILKAPILRAGDEVRSIDRAWPLARALAELMDEAERSGVDLAERLPEAVEERFSEHWQQTLKFLEIVTSAWPKWLAEEGLSNPVARQIARLKAQARQWREYPPETPVWAVGFADGSAAVSELLSAVGSLERGLVVLPGIDLGLPNVLWENLPDAHPQAQLKALLEDLGVARTELAVWGDIWGDDAERPAWSPKHEMSGRENLLRDVLVPEGGLSIWAADRHERDLSGLSLLPAEDQQQEAHAIALALRDVVSLPGRSCALVTPDRGLAQRVVTELLRFGIHADDSSGEALSQTPAAVFLRLVAAAAASGLSPVALLSVLKHPLAALGMTPGNCRASARLLERQLLRGPAPGPGIEGLRQAMEALVRNEVPADTGADADTPDVPEGLTGFIDRIEAGFGPLLDLRGPVPIPDLLEALVRTAENLATTEIRNVEGHENGDKAPSTEPPGARLWLGEDGAALSRHLAALIVHTGELPAQSVMHLDAFLHTSMAGHMLTGLRAHRGGIDLAHPRLSILGVLEARLLAFDTVVMGGLNEGIWPPATDPGPWLSRPMRRRIGLPSPERQIGVSAHDFVSTALSAKNVVFSASARRDGAPGIRARWMIRMAAFLDGRGQQIPVHPALGWQALLDQPLGGAAPVSPPEPRPPVALRPRTLSITEIDKWKQDPYEIYARHVLRLRVLPPLEEGAEHADFGMIVHDALDVMLRNYPRCWPANAAEILCRHFAEALERAQMRPALVAWWGPRLSRIAEWVARHEVNGRERASPVSSHTELAASFVLDAPGGPFRVRGRADRIDIGHDGRAVIFDYKTGKPPTGTDVERGWSAQLVIEGALLAEGAFEGLPAMQTRSLVYWYLTGDREPGSEQVVPSTKSKTDAGTLISGVLGRLRELVEDYDDPACPYRSQPWAGRVPRFPQYAQLARVEEWRATTSEDDA